MMGFSEHSKKRSKRSIWGEERRAVKIAPLRWQDKKGELRLSAASGQPLWLPETALNTQPHTKSPHNTGLPVLLRRLRRFAPQSSHPSGLTPHPRKSDWIPPPV